MNIPDNGFVKYFLWSFGGVRELHPKSLEWIKQIPIVAVGLKSSLSRKKKGFLASFPTQLTYKACWDSVESRRRLKKFRRVKFPSLFKMDQNGRKAHSDFNLF